MKQNKFKVCVKPQNKNTKNNFEKWPSVQKDQHSPSSSPELTKVGACSSVGLFSSNESAVLV